MGPVAATEPCYTWGPDPPTERTLWGSYLCMPIHLSIRLSVPSIDNSSGRFAAEVGPAPAADINRQLLLPCDMQAA